MFFLKEIRRKPVISLKESSCQGIGLLIEQEAIKQSRVLCSKFADDGYSKDVGDKLFSKYLDHLSVFIFSQVVAADVPEVINAIAKSLENVIETFMEINQGKELNKIVQFAGLICNEFTQSLIFPEFHPLMRTDLLRNTYRLTNVKLLVLKESYGDPRDLEKFYSKSFYSLKCLAFLTARVCCSDKIISILSQTCCGTLQELDVEGSCWVTEECIPYLMKFRLRKLDIENTSIGLNGLVGILKNMKTLSALNGNFPFLSILEHQAELNKVFFAGSTQLRIEEFQLSRSRPYYASDEILMLANYCPRIGQLCFKYNPKFMKDFTDLSVFENLSKLEIWGGEYYSSNMFFLLETIGQKLTCLHLCHVEQLSCQSVLHLASHCQAMRELKLENCSWQLFGIENINNEEKVGESNMTSLTILNSIPTDILVWMITNATSLKSLILDGEVFIDKDILQKILEKNKLQQLESFLVYNSRNLFLDSVLLLHEKCPKFKKVRFLENWDGITENDILDFWKEIQEQNIDLDAGEEDWKKLMKKRKEGEEKLEKYS